MNIEDSNSSSVVMSIKRVRLMVLLALLFYPAWGVLYKTIDSSFNDSLMHRSGVLTYFTLLLGLSYVSKFRSYLQLAYLGGIWLLIGHHTYLVFLNQGHIVYLLGSFITLAAIVMAIPSVKSAFWFSIFTMAISVYTVFSSESFEVNRWFYISGVFTILCIGIGIQYVMHSFFNALTESNNKSKAIVDNLSEAVMVMSADGTIVSINSRAAKIFGFPSHFFIGKKINDSNWVRINEEGTVLKNEEYPAVIAFNSKKPVRELVMGAQKPDGSYVWLSVNANPIFNESTGELTGVVTSYHDITEKREQARLLAEQQIMVANTSRMSSLGIMASGIAHEINNPLAIISGRINQLKRMSEEGPVKKEDIQPLIGNIQQTISRISKIIQGLRAFARDGKGDPFSPTQLYSLVEDSVALCKELLQRKEVMLNIDIDKNLLVEVGGVQITQVLVNLIQNAVDAIEDLPKKWIKISAWTTPTDIYLEVEDSGDGIPASIKHKILDPFFTTKEIGKGTGLGLSISLGIVRDHRGQLLIPDGVPNTKFVIVLPLKQPQESSESNKTAA